LENNGFDHQEVSCAGARRDEPTSGRFSGKFFERKIHYIYRAFCPSHFPKASAGFLKTIALRRDSSELASDVNREKEVKMARREVTGRKLGVSADLTPPPPRLALSVVEFCAAFGISEDFFYKLKRQGQAPRLMKVGARTMISMEAANEWRIAREAEAAAKIAAEAAE
jgi:hypothetical protein